MSKVTKMLQTRTIRTVSFRAGQSDTIEIPRGYSIESLRLRLTGTLTRGAGASAGAGKDLTGAQLIKRIEFRKNGREVVKALSFETLMRLNQIAKGTLPEWALSLAWTGFDVKAATTFALSAELAFAIRKALQPLDTLFDSSARNGISTLDMTIYWGQLNDVMTAAYDPAGAAVAATVTPALAVSIREYVDPDGGPYLENREYVINNAIAATNPKLQLSNTPTNMFKQFVIKTYADDVQRNDILNTVTVRSGTEVFMTRNAEELRQENKDDLGLESAITGYYLLDFCPDGHLTRALRGAGRSDLIIEGDVTKQGTNCYIEVIPMELIMPSIPASA